MNTEHPRYSVHDPLFSEHIELNHHIEQWTELIDPSSINHLNAVIDKAKNCRKLRKATMRRSAKQKGR